MVACGSGLGFDTVGDGITVGSYRIDVSGLTSTNYAITYATGTDRGLLTITARPITIKANDVTRALRRLDAGLQPRADRGQDARLR